MAGQSNKTGTLALLHPPATGIRRGCRSYFHARPHLEIWLGIRREVKLCGPVVTVEAEELIVTVNLTKGPLSDVGAGASRRLRVFPRKTNATPKDELCRFGPPDLFDTPECFDIIDVSVTFTYDKQRAEWLAEQWHSIGAVRLGGVAYGDIGNTFIPGRYVKPGYIFTSRGCPRRCWFCKVWHTHPQPILFPIIDGWNILDDNLLACPRPHVEAVFAMLRRQPRRVEFTGGLEALSLEDYQVGLLADLKPRPNCFWAYDPGDAFETLESAARRLIAAGFTPRSHRLNCYVLIGQPGDTFEAAEKRLRDMLGIGFTPRAMLWRPDDKPSQQRHQPTEEWRQFQRRWFRPAIIHARKVHQHTTRPDPPRAGRS